MPEIKFTLSSSNITRLVNAYAFLHLYKDKITIDDKEIDNPETKGQFTRRIILEEMKFKVKGYESDLAKRALPEPDDIDID